MLTLKKRIFEICLRLDSFYVIEFSFNCLIFYRFIGTKTHENTLIIDNFHSSIHNYVNSLINKSTTSTKIEKSRIQPTVSVSVSLHMPTSARF